MKTTSVQDIFLMFARQKKAMSQLLFETRISLCKSIQILGVKRIRFE